MIFLGYAFAAGNYSLDAPAMLNNDMPTVELENGIYGETYVTNDNLPYSSTIPTDWDYNTVMHANFKNNLLAGNIDFTLSQISALRVKRRVKGENNWMIIHEQPVSQESDLSVLYYDITAKSNTTYQYAIVPMFDEIEGKYFANEITTDFRGIFILDPKSIFQTELDVTFSSSKRNKPKSIKTPINQKYPIIIGNGSNNYETVTVSAEWLEYIESDDDWNVANANSYIKSLKDFLNNNYVKLVKYQDGRTWLCDVSSSEISDSEDDSHLQIHTSFDITEVGDCDDGEDLYKYGFINVIQ